MARVYRPTFKRHMTFVAIRPIKLAADTTIKAGQEVKLKTSRLRSLYNRRRIGPKGHPWTNACLEAAGFPKIAMNHAAEAEKAAAKAEKAKADKIKAAEKSAAPAKPAEPATEASTADPQAAAAAAPANGAENGAQAPAAATEEKPKDKKPKAKKAKGPQPVKSGSQWVWPENPEQKFKTKKAALEAVKTQKGEGDASK